MKTKLFRDTLHLGHLWVSAHPYKVIFTALICLQLGNLMAIDALFRPCLIALVVVSAAAGISSFFDIRKIVGLCVAAALLAEMPAKAQPQPVPLLLGCLVVVVLGGVGCVGCRINKACKKKFGTPATNAEPENFYASAPADDQAAVQCIHFKQTCPPELVAFQPGESTSTSVIVSGRLVLTPAGPEIEALRMRITAESDLVAFSEYERRMADYGLAACTTANCSSYGRNGHPIDRTESRIAISTGVNGLPVASVASDQPTFKVAIERSTDLETWTQAMVLETAPTLILFSETQDAAQAVFYRMRVQP